MQTLSKERLGRFTASSIWKLFAGGVTRDTYIFEKAEELVMGHVKEFSNKHTDHGHMHEQEAVENFSEVSGLVVENLLQQYFPINENCGATPDAAVKNFSNVILASSDVKCPTTTFFKQKMIFINESKPKYQNVPKEMFYQGQMQMMALTKHNRMLKHPPVGEHYLVRYLTAMDTDYHGNTIEYDLPLNVRLFYQCVKADSDVQQEIIRLVKEAVEERDILVKILMKPVNQ